MLRYSSVALAATISWISPSFAQSPADRSALPQENSTGRTAIIAQVTNCRTIAAPDARLNCFDKAASALDEALSKKNIVVLDRQAVRDTRRSLFGFNLPRLPFFNDASSDGDEPPEARRIDAVVASANPLRYDNWSIRLLDGALWQTTEAFRGYRDPKAGSTVTITRGALGGYMMQIDKQRAVRVARQN